MREFSFGMRSSGLSALVDDAVGGKPAVITDTANARPCF